MRELIIDGGRRLSGEIKISRAKNSVLALMAASLMIRGEVFINECPAIGDVIVMAEILRSLGAKVVFYPDGAYINASDVFSTNLKKNLTQKIRASFFTVGALVSRFKVARVPRPGGCKIGSRPVDIHLEALKAIGIESFETDEALNFFAQNLTGGNVLLRYPSVGATENVMMAATLADGTTVIRNAAREPEVVDLQRFLRRAGASISGAGTDVIRIDGVKKLNGGFSFTPIEDRIETGTYLLATLSAGGEALLKGASLGNILPLIEKIRYNTCQLTQKNDNIYIQTLSARAGYGNIITAPYPGFPTDLHPQLIAAACSAQGKTALTEAVFENRTAYVGELKKTGADVRTNGRDVCVIGKHIFGAEMTAEDLRGGAALIVAALGAEGRSVVKGMEHVERGYLDMEKKLAALGARVQGKAK